MHVFLLSMVYGRTRPNLVSQSLVYFAKAGRKGIGLYLRNADYRFLEGTSKTYLVYFWYLPSCVLYPRFCTILGTENHISLDIKILRRSCKSIHGKNL